eukprot:6490661-Amphidinium_carterae.2
MPGRGAHPSTASSGRGLQAACSDKIWTELAGKGEGREAKASPPGIEEVEGETLRSTPCTSNTQTPGAGRARSASGRVLPKGCALANASSAMIGLTSSHCQPALLTARPVRLCLVVRRRWQPLDPYAQLA